MTVYIEYVIIDNFVITSLISVISYRILKVAASKKRVSAAAAIGTAAAVLYPFIHAHFAVLLLIKSALYLVLCLILFLKKTRLKKACLVFLLITATMGGAMFMVGFFIYGDALKALTLPAYNLPLGLILLVPIVLYCVLKKLVHSVHKHRDIKDYSYKIEFKVLDKTIKADAFLDSGNLLCDKVSGLPIVVVGGSLTLKILNDDQLKKMLSGGGESIVKSSRYIKFDTISQGGQILIVKAQKFRLYLSDGQNILKEVMLGLTLTGLNGFDALLPAGLF